MSEKITIELSEQDSAIIQLSLELREMYFPPHNLKDRRRLPELKKELAAKHNEVFIEPRQVKRKLKSR